MRRGAGWLARHRTGRGHRWAQVFDPLRRLTREPRALAVLVAASGCTTLVLGLAFVATTRILPGPVPSGGLGALLLAFMLGSAAGSAVPVPAGLGSTEAAAGHAVVQVIIFRLLTFWAPAAVGVLATRHLYRRRVL